VPAKRSFPPGIGLPAAFLGAALLLAPGPGVGQERALVERVDITGRVVDAVTRLPISGVLVQLPEVDLALRTDERGVFKLANAPVGTYELRLSAPGYRTSQGAFAIVRPGGFTATLQPLSGGEGVPPGQLVGHVAEAGTDRPIPAVRVRVPALFLDGLTGDDGRFAFADVPPGRHEVEFANLGYAVRRDTVEVVSRKTSEVRVSLSVDPVEVEPITVTVERREPVLERHGFYERRRVSVGGRFIDREAIEAQAPVEMVDIFRRIPGAEVRLADPMNPMTRAIILRGGRGELRACYPSVYLDGIVVHRASQGPAMLNFLVDPGKVAGIEVYQGGASMPVQYGGTLGGCGAIVIWTR